MLLVNTPFIVYSIFHRLWAAAFTLFVIAALTDVLDGYFARLLQEPTVLGTWLDPLADKCLLLSTFSALGFVHFPSLGVPPWFVLLVVIRESVLILGVLTLVLMRRPLVISPTIWGKSTTFFQILFISWLFICYFNSWSPRRTYAIALVVLTILTLFSLVTYVRTGMKYAKKS